MDDKEQRLALEKLSRDLSDRGKLIESGWVAFRLFVVPADAPQIQIDEMRHAYMAGAQHLFSSVMTIMEPGNEPTDADLRRMDLIADELDAFAKELSARVNK